MTENTNDNNKEKISLQEKSDTPIVQKKIKPPKIEDKPFKEFIEDHLIPTLSKSLQKHKVNIDFINLTQGQRPVTKDIVWNLSAGINNGRRFWLSFSENKITSPKTISIAETGSEPTLIESFLIDEKKITLPLLISRILQRLNGQKWLSDN